MDRQEIVARARGCLGARFRPQGRSADLGLDCVGVAAIAFDRLVPSGYALRGGRPGEIVRRIDDAGLRRVAGASAAAGDLLLVAMGQGQLHLAVLTESGFIHADAGLRRVVETPGRPKGTILGAWTEAG